MSGSLFSPHNRGRAPLDQTDIRLLRELEHGLPLVPAPFEAIGKCLGLSESDVMERIRRLNN